MKLTEFCKEINFPREAEARLEKMNDTEYEEIKILFQKDKDAFFKEILKKDDSWMWFLYYYSRMACDTWEKYKNRGISEEIFRDTFSDITIWCENCRKKTGNYGIHQYDWIVLHIEMKLFRLGRLQFETVQKEDVVNVHIPQGIPLDREECIKSFRKAFLMFGREKAFLCHSWLLGPELPTILGEESNIIKFRDFFEIVRYDYDIPEAEERIFGKVHKDPSLYPEVTSLQKNAKTYLLRGGRLGNGIGILKKNCL